MRSEHRPSYRPDLQGLRAVAVLLVVASHLLDVPAGGYVGVDVFFVLSGFLITGLLLREHAATGRLDLREFYARRARRLLPAAVLVLAVTNLAGWLVFRGERAGQTLADSVWALGLANVRFAALGTDYFDDSRPPSPVQHYWSLAVEEQYYLVWPILLLALLGTRRRGVVLTAAVALTAASGAWSVLHTAAAPTAAYFSTATRAWELGVGGLLALFLQGRDVPLGRRTAAALSRLGLTGIAASALLLDERTAYPGAAAALPVLATALVVLAAGRSRLLVNPVSDYVGRLSYSLYLWHWPAIVVGAALLPAGWAGVAAGTASVVLSVLSLHLVEEPVRRSGWLSRRPAPARHGRALRAAVALGAVAGLALGGWVVPALALRTPDLPVADGAPLAGVDGPAHSSAATAAALRRDIAASVAPATWPALDLPLGQISRTGAPEWLVDRCDNVNAGNVRRCRYGDLTAPRTAVLVGDSMATSWLPALREVLDPQVWSIQVLTRNQCPLPRLGFWREHPAERYAACDEHKDWAFEQVRRLRPDLVLASHSLTFLDHQQGEPTGPARFASWRTGLQDSLRVLGSSAGRVVLLGPPPRAGNLQACVTRLSSPVDCTTDLPRDWIELRSTERAAAAATGAQYVDVEELFCAAQRCPAVVGSTPVYTDGRHLTAAYARRLVPRLEQLLALG